MGPLILLMFAGHLGWSAMMGNATANDTNCHNATQPQGNMTCNNMTMPMKNETHPHHNMTMPPKNETHPHHNVTMPPKNETHPHHNMTMPPPVTKPAPPPAPKMNLKFKINQNFTEALKNKSSAAFKKMETDVTTQLNVVYSKKFGPAFNKTIINGFSQGSIKVDAELLFNNASDLPEASQVTSTLVEAASSGNFSLSVNTSSIEAEVVTPKADPTTAAPVTEKESVTTSADATLQLVFILNETFTSELANKSSPEFKALENTITTVLDKILKKIYGNSFIEAEINSFKKGSVVVDSTLKFSNQSSVPAASDATSQLSSSLTNSSLKVVAGSVSATSNAATANATAAPNATVATTSGLSTDPPTSSEGTLGLLFTLSNNYNNDYANSSSSAFKELATVVLTEINSICGRLFGSAFLRSIINSFKPGSVKVDMTLVYKDKDSVPSASNATALLSEALLNSSVLKVVNGSVSAQSTTSSGCQSQPSVLALLASSLALVAAAQTLIRF